LFLKKCRDETAGLISLPQVGCVFWVLALDGAVQLRSRCAIARVPEVIPQGCPAPKSHSPVVRRPLPAGE